MPSESISPRRGDVVRVKFDPTEGSEQAGERPAIVISPDFINERAPIVIVVPLTSRKTEHPFAHEALIEPPDGGIPKRSKAMLIHMRGIDKLRIIATYGSISAETMSRVEEALKIATGLTPLDANV